MEKALVLFSGGLDSRLAVKLMQEQDYKVEAIFFNLPFGCGCCNFNCAFKFLQIQGVKLTIVDCSSGKLFKEYLKIIKNPKHGTGTGINPCKDCKIFMLKKAKEYADKHNIKIISTGEVLGQRPMSQTKQALNLIDKKLNFKIKRPLIEAGCQGRQRKIQIQLAKKFKIKYPNPAGGCLLCEKIPGKRIKFLLDKNLITEKTLPLTSLSRHFYIDNEWFVVGKNEVENKVIEGFKNSVKSGKGKPAVYYYDKSKKNKAEEIQNLYHYKNTKNLEEFKI